MATTLSLNSNDSIMVTTFWGGEQGRCYTIHLFIGDLEIQTTLNEEEFLEMVMNYNDDVVVSPCAAKPQAENRRVAAQRLTEEVEPIGPRTDDPELDRLLEEEEELAERRQVSFPKEANRVPRTIKACYLNPSHMGRRAMVAGIVGDLFVHEDPLPLGGLIRRFRLRTEFGWYTIDDDDDVELDPIEDMRQAGQYVPGKLVNDTHVGRRAKIGTMTGVIVKNETTGLYCLNFPDGGWTFFRDTDHVEIL